MYRRGTLNTNGTITWPLGEQTVYNGNIACTDRYAEGNIAVDTNGYAFIWAKHYHTFQADSNTPWVFKNANKDGTWITDTGFPFQLNTGTTEWRGLIVPLTAGKMYAIYAVAGSTIRGRLWNGSGWEAEETDVADYPAAVDPGTQWGGVFSATAKGDDVYFAYLRATTNQVRFNKRTYGGSPAWAATDTLVQDSVTSASAPVITMKMDTGDIYVFWAGAPAVNHIYYRKRTSAGTWDSTPTDWINESTEGLTRNDKITGYFKDYGSKIGLVYQTGTSSPWNIKFAALDFGVALSANNVSGWAWSENIGWISFNCNNSELPAPRCTIDYGVHICTSETDERCAAVAAPKTGKFVGYAWSRGTDIDVGGVGWIKFDPVGPYPTCPISTCPTGSPNYSTKADLSTGKVTGWARVCAAAPDPSTCGGGVGANPNAGGWDGWILLGPIVKGSPPTDYGVLIDFSVSPAQFRNWAWGSDVVGWISFNCSNQGVCSASNYKVITSFIFNQPPSAINLSVDPPNSTDYCGITGYPLVRLRWQFSDLGDSQSAYQIQVATSSGFSPLVLDTGKITGLPGQSQAFVIQPPYPTLSWNTTYYWRLKVWDSKDTPSTDWIVYQNNIPPPESFTTASHSYPYPNFTPSPKNPAIEEVVTFIDNSKCYSSPGNTEYSCSTGGSISYLWDFGNGQTSTTKGDATTTYTTTGSKTVRLTITDNSLTPAGSCDAARQVTIALPLPEWEEIPPF
jgi:hypothetical protein